MSSYVIDAGNVFLTDGLGNLFIVGASTKTVTTRINDTTVEDDVYSFDKTVGDYVKQSSTQRADDRPLQDVKTDKLASLQATRDNEIYTTFQSSALGTPHTYTYSQEAAANFEKKTALLGIAPSITTISWYTVENGFVDHTRDQFVQVCLDGGNREEQLKMKYFQLEAQVSAATDISTVSAIAW